MNQFKQNLWVVSILFFSLMTSVALSYAITPAATVKKVPAKAVQLIKVEKNKLKLNQILTLLIPQVVK